MSFTQRFFGLEFFKLRVLHFKVFLFRIRVVFDLQVALKFQKIGQVLVK